MKTIKQIIAEIGYTLTTTCDGLSIIRDLTEGETIAIYGPEDNEAAEKHYESLLTAEQLEALQIDWELSTEEMYEAQGNREISGQW